MFAVFWIFLVLRLVSHYEEMSEWEPMQRYLMGATVLSGVSIGEHSVN